MQVWPAQGTGAPHQSPLSQQQVRTPLPEHRTTCWRQRHHPLTQVGVGPEQGTGQELPSASAPPSRVASDAVSVAVSTEVESALASAAGPELLPLPDPRPTSKPPLEPELLLPLDPELPPLYASLPLLHPAPLLYLVGHVLHKELRTSLLP